MGYKFSNRGLKMSYVNNLWRSDSALLTITDSKGRIIPKITLEIFWGKVWGVKIENTCILLSSSEFIIDECQSSANQSQHHSQVLDWYKNTWKLFLKGNMESSSAGYTMENKGKNGMPVPPGRIFMLADTSFFWQWDKLVQRISRCILFLLVYMNASSLLSIDH